MQTTSILKIENLEFGYSNRPSLLKIPHFELMKNERVFLYGDSGSGKTTLLGLVAGILPTESGSIKVLGRDLKAMSASQRDIFRGNHLGYIFQLFNLVPYLSVIENISLSCEMNLERLSRLKKSLHEEATHIARSLGIESILHKSVIELSVGQQQRVAVARALLGNPELIIADEPTSALDADHREKFIQLLFKQCEESGATLIFVSHDKSIQSQFSRSVSLAELNRSTH
jgi:putative ABC transport system ATP-binding protein